MHMSEHLLSVKLHVSSFGTGAKFNKEMLQKDDLMMPKSLVQARNLLQNNIHSSTQSPVSAEKRVKHPYFLRSRQLSIP